MKKIINIVLAALMVFAIGACEEKKSQVGSASTEKNVKIGNQIWMAKNLNDASKGGICYGDKPENCEKYGRLYNWEEAMKACPSGWHLPSDAEWKALVSFAGGDEIAGRKLKAKNGWEEGGNGTDDFGFSALPGGSGYSDGSFDVIDRYGYWWSSSEHGSYYAYFRDMGYDNEFARWIFYEKSYLFSVRCLKD